MIAVEGPGDRRVSEHRRQEDHDPQAAADRPVTAARRALRAAPLKQIPRGTDSRLVSRVAGAIRSATPGDASTADDSAVAREFCAVSDEAASVAAGPVDYDFIRRRMVRCR
jgi:hypothetical protein